MSQIIWVKANTALSGKAMFLEGIGGGEGAYSGESASLRTCAHFPHPHKKTDTTVHTRGDSRIPC